MEEKRLLDEFGILKFGVATVALKVEWRCVLVMFCDSRTGMGTVCIDLRLSLMAEAFGLGRLSSIDILGVMSSKVVDALSLVGERSSELLLETVIVGWPDDI
jgi:hypothetical protein